jgi:hypothetical protein
MPPAVSLPLAREGAAREVLDEMRRPAARRYVSANDFAIAHLGLGETESALDWLEKGYVERTHQVAFIGVGPRVDHVRAAPPFRALLERLRRLQVSDGLPLSS